MTWELYGAMLLFAFATFFTPGPNNIMLMTSGLNFGFRRTRPHLFGVSMGFGAMMACFGLGLGVIFKAYPLVSDVLKIVVVLFLLYLAWRIANAGPVDGKLGGGRPLTFLQAAAFQWVNPKAWVIALSAMASFVPRSGDPATVVLIAVTFATIGTVSAATWALSGTLLQRLLQTRRAVKTFNIVMALLLVASLYPVFVEVLGLLRQMIAAI